MKSISKNITNEIIINKSKFITKLIKVNSIDEVNNKLDSIKKEYKDSTHICYAYICGINKKASDNGEPSGTAGMPILNVLEKNDLNYLLAVVIRYFGGIKLGAGGLVRAYSSSIVDCLNKTDIVSLIDGYKVKLVISYDKIKLIDNLLKDINVTYKEFDENVSYELNIDCDNKVIDELKNNAISFTMLDKIKIAKV